jgi:serine/threonine-protein kinase
MSLLVVERYELYEELASGGMATVYLGRLRGESGFARTIAVKRLHRHIARDPQFVSMFLDEARLASRIHHPNVVSTLDVVRSGDELLLVMDYVRGEALGKIWGRLVKTGKRAPQPIVGAIISGVLQGLHAAHEASDERGEPLGIVHRDVSPQNILVGADGVVRVTDFGVAKAAGRIQTTADGQIKGKAAYMPPEQIAGVVDRRTDVFAVATILWELLTGKRLFQGGSQVQTIANVLAVAVPPPRTIEPSVSEALEELVLAGLDREPSRRFATAREMDQALRRAMPIAASFEVAEWLEATMGDTLAAQARLVAAIETEGVVPSSPNVERPAHDAATTDDVLDFSKPSPTAAPVRLWRGLALGAGLFALAAAAGLVWMRGRPPQAANGSSPAVGSAAPPSASVSSDVAVGALASSQAAVSAPLASATGSVSPDVAPRGSSRGVRRDVTPTRGHASAGGKDCNPPYTVDERGRHFKEECL